MVWMRAEANEQPSDYARRLTAEGLMPFEVIKSLRTTFNLDLDTASALVITAEEIAIFLDAQVRRGLCRRGAVRLASKVYGMTKANAEAAVWGHGGFEGSVH